MELQKQAKLFLYLLQTFLYPLHTFDYFQLYCRFIRQTVKRKRPFFRAIVWVANVFLCLDLVNFAYLSTLTGKEVESDNKIIVAHFNYWYLLLGKNIFNLLMVIATVNTMYNANCLFLKADYKLVVRLLGRILFQQKASFFLYKTIRKPFLRVLICKHIRTYFSIILTSFKPSILLSNLIMILGNVLTIKKLLQLMRNSTCTELELLKITATYLVKSFASIFSLLLLAHIFTLIFSIALTLICVVKIKFRQIDDLLGSLLKSGKTDLETTFYKFKRSYLHTLGIFFRINSMFANLFATFLMAIFPINLLCGMLILFDKELPPEGTFILIYLGTVHLLCLFLFHLIVASLSATIHQPRIRLGIIIAKKRQQQQQQQQQTDLKLNSGVFVKIKEETRENQKRLQISMHLLYCALNVKKIRFYGFTYSNICLVTMANFFKVLEKLIY